MSFDNVRRMAERGLKMAQSPPIDSSYVDIFQHILDEYEREAKAIRDNTIDECVKVADSSSQEEKISADGYDYNDGWDIACKNIADKLKELK